MHSHMLVRVMKGAPPGSNLFVSFFFLFFFLFETEGQHGNAKMNKIMKIREQLLSDHSQSEISREGYFDKRTHDQLKNPWNLIGFGITKGDLKLSIPNWHSSNSLGFWRGACRIHYTMDPSRSHQNVVRALKGSSSQVESSKGK